MARQRNQPDDVNRLRARPERPMVPLSTIVSSRPINGPQYSSASNVYSAATIKGTKPRYSSGGDRRWRDRARAAAGWLRMDERPTRRKRPAADRFIFAISLVFVLLCRRL